MAPRSRLLRQPPHPHQSVRGCSVGAGGSSAVSEPAQPHHIPLLRKRGSRCHAGSLLSARIHSIAPLRPTPPAPGEPWGGMHVPGQRSSVGGLLGRCGTSHTGFVQGSGWKPKTSLKIRRRPQSHHLLDPAFCHESPVAVHHRSLICPLVYQ